MSYFCVVQISPWNQFLWSCESLHHSQPESEGQLSAAASIGEGGGARFPSVEVVEVIPVERAEMGDGVRRPRAAEALLGQPAAGCAPR